MGDMNETKKKATQDCYEKKRAEKLATIHRAIEVLGWKIDDLKHHLADSWVKIDELLEANERLANEQGELHQLLNIFGGEHECDSNARALLLQGFSGSGTNSATLILKGIEQEKTSSARISGKAGAVKRHEPMTKLKKWTIEQYKALIGETDHGESTTKKVPSANKCASDLKERVIAHGRAMRPVPAVLAEHNAQKTIAEWICSYRSAGQSGIASR